jgi:tetratricopeptide (TPR) repeat protein
MERQPLPGRTRFISPRPSVPKSKPPKAPPRDVSNAAKAAFEAAVDLYKSARKSGLKAQCAEVAGAFAKVFDSHPKLPEAKFNEGVVWSECGELGKAEQTYQALLSKHPNFGPALNNIGEILFLRGQVGAAESYFKRAAEQKDSSGYANLALLQRNQALSNPGAVAEAIENIHRALAVDSFNIDAYGTMATVLYDHAKTRAQLEIARLICEQASKINAGYAPIYNVSGLVLLRMGRVTPALAKFRKAVEIDPNLMEAHMNIGAVTLSFRDYASAEQAFSKVLSLNPPKKTRLEALIGLGVAYRGQRKFKEAMKKYQEAQAMDPSNVDIAYNMGILVQDYTFDASNPAAGIAALQQATSYLQRYASAGRNQEKVKDAQKRLKNINELIPMLQEQQKMVGGGAQK